MKRACLLVCLFALAACGKADNDPGPGGITVGEAKAPKRQGARIDWEDCEDGDGSKRIAMMTVAVL